MTQEEEDLVDPQDDIELEAQRKQKEASEENEKDNMKDQGKPMTPMLK